MLSSAGVITACFSGETFEFVFKPSEVLGRLPAVLGRLTKVVSSLFKPGNPYDILSVFKQHSLRGLVVIGVCSSRLGNRTM